MSLLRRLFFASVFSLALVGLSERGLSGLRPQFVLPNVFGGSAQSSSAPTATVTPAVLAPTATPRPLPSPTPTPVMPLDANTTVLDYPPPPIAAKAAILVDMETGKVLFAQNPDARLPMASTTKITTAIVVLEHARLNEMVRVSERAATIGESTMSLVQGERLTVRQLLYGLLLNSGNDAAVALAEHVGGTEQRFVGMMNALARHLGLHSTHYATPHGLDTPDHYTSARDLAKMAIYAMRDPIFRKIVATTSYYIPATKHNQVHWLANINRVMYWYPGVDGVKPGDTDAAGLCQVVSVNRDGRHLLAVLLNTPTLVFDIRNLLNYGLHDFRWIQAPAYWDYPANNASGGSGTHRWIYYYGSGHFIRGLFYSYFRTHGGLSTLGYPLTDVVDDAGRHEQYFEGGELVYDPAHDSVYPEPLGWEEQPLLAQQRDSSRARTGWQFAGLYKQLGGRGVLGEPVGPVTVVGGHTVQFFRYGELGLFDGTPYEVPIGTQALTLRGWLPATGAPNVFGPTMSQYLVWTPPAPKKVRIAVGSVDVPVLQRRLGPAWSPAILKKGRQGRSR